MDRNIATACTAEVPQLKPLNWRIASSHTKVCGRLLHATPVPARTRSNNLTSSAGADKVDSAILGEKEPFFATFVKPSEAKRLVVKRALGRHPQDLSPRFFFASRANAWDLGHRMSPSRLDYGTARRTRPSTLKGGLQLVSCSNHSFSRLLARARSSDPCDVLPNWLARNESAKAGKPLNYPAALPPRSQSGA